MSQNQFRVLTKVVLTGLFRIIKKSKKKCRSGSEVLFEWAKNHVSVYSTLCRSRSDLMGKVSKHQILALGTYCRSISEVWSRIRASEDIFITAEYMTYTLAQAACILN